MVAIAHNSATLAFDCCSCFPD